ncbi:hypothetical protein [Bacillus wiedmannii]|uniref:hypothetical protein n=1 Tax=Bacillus wiedmannii TaxID=1890302 RepID=UPI000BF16EFA|nr:hypothetical protein [Bacillus wiedmannii]PEK57857.1 hypothetical protein CN595_24750 [Bacillus wiedmannii]
MTCLYKFNLKEDKIEFSINKEITAYISTHYDDMLQLLVNSLKKTLHSYRVFSKQPTILSAQISNNKQLEIILGEGLGEHIDIHTKEQIFFNSGRRLADILLEVKTLNSNP